MMRPCSLLTLLLIVLIPCASPWPFQSPRAGPWPFQYDHHHKCTKTPGFCMMNVMHAGYIAMSRQNTDDDCARACVDHNRQGWNKCEVWTWNSMTKVCYLNKQCYMVKSYFGPKMWVSGTPACGGEGECYI